ncbi:MULTISPECIES: hypothetical protein [unclassified Acinetobacter]|uniref:hypothetical protein n=1 Tax=unclassified Acinetobacter TaxID=196816 RepID=UPI00190DF4CD|nr:MULTISPECIES: hypothetical protein [unclassified Acinetobacter]MBK0062970.1 hypothetical protein [Acinetobacter sp. S55]MBK0066612.1 hypothetical protein [Acinetobacter sp. S54]
MSGVQDHEIVEIFKTYLYPLSEKLTEMLNEHYSHQTERRGCGYTQATRVIAEIVNQARDHQNFQDLRIFSEYETKLLRILLNQSSSYQIALHSWRNLDQNDGLQNCLNIQGVGEQFHQAVLQESGFQAKLRELHQHMQLEESVLICKLIEDIILPKSAEQNGWIELKTLNEKPKVGSCPLAEKFFLKVAHRRLLRQGEINIFIDSHEQPIMIEKLNMGDNHSCISLQPLIMNGVRLPAGCLFSVSYDAQCIPKRANKNYKGNIMSITDVEGFWFLRLTTLAISPENRARAFSHHFKQQVQNGLFRPESTELSQLKAVAQEQI